MAKQQVKTYQCKRLITLLEFANDVDLNIKDCLLFFAKKGYSYSDKTILSISNLEELCYRFDINLEISTNLKTINRLLSVDKTNKNQTERPPVVAVMGHIDHGKTTLLDFIRKTNTASREKGLITQHIGAYQVTHNNKKITFIDTPGHEAFSAIRSHGASVTDIVLIVISATEGIRQQTKEVINLAKINNLTCIIVINKIDLPTANVKKTKEQLAAYEITPEEWGGKDVFVEISAKTGKNIDQLLDAILLVAEMKHLTCNYDANPNGIIIEAAKTNFGGSAITVILQQGILKPGNYIQAYNNFAKIKAINDENGKRLKSLAPSQPGQIIGFLTPPSPGDQIIRVDDAKMRDELQVFFNNNFQIAKQNYNQLKINDITTRLKDQAKKKLNIIIKADTQGSIDAVLKYIPEITSDELMIVPVHCSIGEITQQNVQLAKSVNAPIFALNIRPKASITNFAKQSNVAIHDFTIIYQLLNALDKFVTGMLDAKKIKEVIGTLRVKQIFKIKKQTIAGCVVEQGLIKKGAHVAIIRNQKVIYESAISELRRFKQEVTEVKVGIECGIKIANYQDIKIDDAIESYVIKEIEQQAKFSKEGKNKLLHK